MASKNEIKIPLSSYYRLRYSWDMILSIEDFIDCIAVHKNDLKSPRNIGLMEFMKFFYNNKDFNPSGVLKDYIYLEANSFFEFAKILKLTKGHKDMPDLPDYLKELKNFRDIMVGHRDRREKIAFPQGWFELQEKNSKLIPIKKLIKDVDDYFHSLKYSPNLTKARD